MINVIMYSTQIQTNYIRSLLSASGVEVYQVTRELLLQWSSEGFFKLPGAELALVDPQKMDAGIILNQLRELKIPVVLIVEVGDVNWDRLLDIDGFGYLQINSAPQVLAARLKAILRRFTPAGTTSDQLSKSIW